MKNIVDKIKLHIGVVQPPFLIASIVPVLVGSSLGYAVTRYFHWFEFLLALFAIVFIHAGCNMFNDYFDHKTGADWKNMHPSIFSGGSRYIQKGLMSPEAVLIQAFILVSTGSFLGLMIAVDNFILYLGIAGVILGVLYTAPPVKFCYRGLGEIIIAILFGILPVVGAFHLQIYDFYFEENFDVLARTPAMIIAILIFLVILINEFPDVKPDSEVGKKTLVVRFGIGPCVVTYRLTLVLTYVIAGVSLFGPKELFWASLFYLFTLPLGINVFMLANNKELTEPKRFIVNARTILLHLAGGLVMTAGFIWTGLRG